MQSEDLSFSPRLVSSAAVQHLNADLVSIPWRRGTDQLLPCRSLDPSFVATLSSIDPNIIRRRLARNPQAK